MNDEDKTKEELIVELRKCRAKIEMLEAIIQNKQKPAPVSSDYYGTETILLVEDEESVRDIVKSILVNYGYKVLEAKNGNEALEMSKDYDGPIHLTLSDVMMPGLSGPEFVQRIQSFKPEIKVIYMSGFAEGDFVPDDVFDVLDSEATLLEKPFKPESLAGMVRATLDGGHKK